MNAKATGYIGDRAMNARLGRRALLGATATAAGLACAHADALSALTRQDAGTPASSRVVAPAEIFVTGFDSPEGPAFDTEGNFFFVNWNTGAILKVTPDGQVSEWFNTGGIPAGLAFHPDGSLYVADEGDAIHGIMRITPDGDSTILVNEFEGTPLNGSNDLMFDQQGVLYFSDPWPWGNPDGAFYRYFPDGKLELIDTGLLFPNGVAVTADGSYAILAESGTNRLLRYPIAADGTVGPREEWVVFDHDGGPDGMALGANGELFMAHSWAGHVDVIDPSGTVVEQIPVPAPHATNCAFGGEGNRTLMVTEVESASVYRLELSVAGLPLYDGRNYD